MPFNTPTFKQGGQQSMFGIGTSELLVILIVALIVLGPKSLPQMARTLGKALGEFRRVSTDFQRTLNTEIELDEHEKRKKEAEKEFFAEAKPEAQPQPAAKPEVKPEVAADVKPEVKAEVAAAAKAETVVDVKAEHKTPATETAKTAAKESA